MEVDRYLEFRGLVVEFGYGEEIDWSETVQPPKAAEEMAWELIYVICNSGMRWTVAREIYNRIVGCLKVGGDPSEAFGHKGKCGAIRLIWAERDRIYSEYMSAEDKLSYLETLPWIGPITKYHAAKNFGVDCVKPDRHLARLADAYSTTPEDLCRKLAEKTGDRVATVDLVLWRAAERGWLNTELDAA